jgi:hypothetical protein
MYARLVTSQLYPGAVDEAVQIFRDSVVPDAKQQPGFQVAMALVNRSANKCRLHLKAELVTLRLVAAYVASGLFQSVGNSSSSSRFFHCCVICFSTNSTACSAGKQARLIPKRTTLITARESL